MPPNAALVFDIEVIEIKDGAKPQNVFKEVDMDNNKKLTKEEVILGKNSIVPVQYGTRLIQEISTVRYCTYTEKFCNFCTRLVQVHCKFITSTKYSFSVGISNKKTLQFQHKSSISTITSRVWVQYKWSRSINKYNTSINIQEKSSASKNRYSTNAVQVLFK